MKRLLLFICYLISSIVFAQSPFIIRGYGKDLKETDIIYLSYSKNGKWVLDSSKVKQGSFGFKGEIENFQRAYICRNDNPSYAEFLRDSYDVYLERGTIDLKSPDTLKNIIGYGTALNEMHSQLLKVTKPITAKYRSFKNTGDFSATERKDMALVKAAKAKALAIYEEEMIAKLNFANQHPSSYVSLYHLSRVAHTSKFLPMVETAFKNFPAELRKLPEGKEIANRISEGKKTKIGMLSPDFEQPDVDGAPVKLTSYRDKYVLVDFWDPGVYRAEKKIRML